MKVGKQGVETRARSQVVKKGGGEVKRNRGGISRAVDKEETGQKEKKKSEREKERKGNRKMEVPDLQDQFFAPEPTLGYSKPTF